MLRSGVIASLLGAWGALVATGCDASSTVTPSPLPPSSPDATVALPPSEPPPPPTPPAPPPSPDAGESIDAGTPDADAGIDATPPPPPPPPAGDAGTPPDPVGTGCHYALVEERVGVLHTVHADDAIEVIRPLEPGEGFYCLRMEVTMATPNNLAETDAAYEGCPIFSHVAGVRGGTPEGRNVGGAFFRFLKLDCTARMPGALQVDVWSLTDEDRSSTSTARDWTAGRSYRVVIEVVPFTTTVTLLDPATGAALGEPVTVDISGSTVAMVRDTEIILGLDEPHDGAYFPYYGAVYSDLRVWASVAAPDES